MRIARLIALAGATLAWLGAGRRGATPDAADRCAALATSLRPKDRP